MKNQNNIGKKILGILMALALPVLVYVLFGVLSGGRMFNARAITTTLRTTVQPAIICYALLLGMNIGMMNFSAGAIVLCSAIIGSGLSNMLGWGLPGLILFAMLTALLCSAIMGGLYNWLRVPSMVLSLGLMLVYEALPRVFFPAGAVIATENGFLARVPWIFVVAAITMFIFYVLFNKTAYGHNVRAIGANQPVALAAGLNLDKIKFINFLVSGIFLGIAAVLHMSNSGKIQNVAALGSMTVMMDAFMGVFLGMLLSRWSDPSISVFCGVLTMKIMATGFVAVGLEAVWKDVVTGVFMLIIMTISVNAAIPAIKRANNIFKGEAEAEYAKQLD
ncbi:MAG: ABC transporter permease [Christensenellales bacterium]|nr:ABC transporter permease [Clostridiales bacterium]